MRARLRRRALSTGKARVEALRPTASAGVGGGPWSCHPPAGRSVTRCWVGSETTGRRFAAIRWRRCVGASIHSRVRRARCDERAALANESPSRHDPWPFFRCVRICVIAIAWARGLWRSMALTLLLPLRWARIDVLALGWLIALGLWRSSESLPLLR